MRLPRLARSPARPPEAPTPQALLTIDYHWREAGGCWLQGWFHAYDRRVLSARFLQDEGDPVEVTSRQPRTDVLAHYPMLPDGAATAGFRIHLPRQGGSVVRLILQISGGERTAEARLTPPPVDEAAIQAGLGRSEAAFERFRAEANDRQLDVLEIGARPVGINSTPRRDQFPHARRYIAMDVHPGDGIDLVGDAHRLSDLTGMAALDAIFSFAVLEHLAMPWLAAIEMNRALRVGGLVFHRTHQSFPVHEQPNDFWRYSDEAMRVLFGPVHGFEIIDTAMALPVAMYPRVKDLDAYHVMPLFAGYADVFVLARKIGEIGGNQEVSEVSRRYPNQDVVF